MRLDNHITSLATQCLWSLQEATTSIEGLLLSRVDGLTLTSTMQGDDSTQRLAAASTAMFLLCERASNSWGQGESTEVHIKLRKELPGGDDFGGRTYNHVFMRPIGYQAVLIAVCNDQSKAGMIHLYLDQAAEYLQAILNNETPTLPRWDS